MEDLHTGNPLYYPETAPTKISTLSLHAALPIPPDGVRPRRWTRAEYHRAADLGLFQPDERLELLDGEIFKRMSPQNPPHAYSVLSSRDLLAIAFGPDHHVRPQLPLILNDESEPE